MTQSELMDVTEGRVSLSRRNLKDVVADKIREQIFRGELAPGTRIDQHKLAEALGLSKLPIREALISLEAEGLVKNIPRRGSFIVPLTADEIKTHYDIYGLITGFAAERAATRLTEGDLVRLAQLNQEMTLAEGPSEQEHINFEFHRVIDHAAGSTRLNAVLRTLGQSMPREFFFLTPGWHEEAIQDHTVIWKALLGRDGKAANLAMVEHIRNGGVRAASILETAWQEQSNHPKT